jgi:arsenate reductase
MAEAIFRRYGDGIVEEVVSAGTDPTEVNPLAIKVMKEIGLDISHHESKSVEQFADREFDFVFTVCDNARETCPTFPNAEKKLHWPYEDPALAEGSEEERLKVFRKVRDDMLYDIREFLGE